MKYLLNKKIFESKPLLLNIKDNVDNRMISIIDEITPSGGSILEISCGNGSDSIELIKRGYSVISTEKNDGYYDFLKSKINCIKHDTRDEFPFVDNKFDLVYSRLGLHYFTEIELESIFDEIYRLTKSYLVFSVKLVNDIPTGKKILTKETWEKLVSNKFEIVSSDVYNGILYNNESKWLEIVAKK